MKHGLLILPFLLCGQVAGQDDVSQAKPTWVNEMLAARQSLKTPTPKREFAIVSLCRRMWQDFPEMDWFMQDNPYRDPEASRFDVQREYGWYLDPNRDAAGERKMICRVLAELSNREPLQARLDELARENPSPNDSRWLELYVDACRQRRKLRLEPVLKETPEIVFVKHYTLGGSHYAYTEGQSDAQAERHFKPGSALCLMRYDGMLDRKSVV